MESGSFLTEHRIEKITKIQFQRTWSVRYYMEEWGQYIDCKALENYSESNLIVIEINTLFYNYKMIFGGTNS